MRKNRLSRFMINMVFLVIMLLCLETNTAKAEINYPGIKDKETAEIIKSSPSPDEPNPFVTAIMLLHDEKYTIKDAKTAIFKKHVIIKVLKEGGKDAGTVAIPFNEYFEKIKLNIARTIQPDGEMQDVSADAIKDESPYTGLPIYRDIKIKKITFPNIQVGSIIEYESESAIDNKFIPGFSYIYAIPMNWTLSLIRFTVEVPKDLPVKFKAERFLNNEPAKNSNSGYDTYTWQMDHTYVKGSDEPSVPNYMKVGPYVIFSTIESWQKVNDWWIELMQGQFDSDAQIQKKVEELAKGLKGNKADIIKAVYNYISQQIRYVAIELGISGYKPYPATEVFRNAYGDCKGKSALLIAMLRSAGIPAYPALLRTADAGFVVKEVPSVIFNHMIVAVPDGQGYIFLDPTADMLSFDKVPYYDQNCDVFVLTKDKKEDFVSIPLGAPEDNRIAQETKIVLNRDYSATLEDVSTFTGQSGWEYRLFAKYTPPVQYRKSLEEAMRLVFPGFELTDLTHSEYNDLETPFNIKLTSKINNYSQKSGNLFIFKVPMSVPLPSFLFTKAPRQAPLYLRFPFVMEHKTTVRLPDGYKVKSIPQDLILDNSLVSSNKEFKVEDKKIIINSKWTLKTNEVSAGKYGSFKNMIDKINLSANESIVLEEEGQN